MVVECGLSGERCEVDVVGCEVERFAVGRIVKVVKVVEVAEVVEVVAGSGDGMGCGMCVWKGEGEGSVCSMAQCVSRDV